MFETFTPSHPGPHQVSPSFLISHYERELSKAEQEVAKIKRTLSALRKSLRGDAPLPITDLDLALANIKWRKEIRHCLTLSTDFHLMSSNEIAACVVKTNNLPGIDRNIKTKVSSTLSLMHKEGEIGRVRLKHTADFFYGIKEYFESDLTTLKAEYLPRIEHLLEK